jgi:type II secretory pathway component GspD/PulD (secretin)
VTEPAVTEPAVTEPAATEPAATEPAATEPAATEPAVTEPAVTEPAATEPAATEPAATEPAATEPAVTEPAAIAPTTTVPVPTTLVPEATAPATTAPAATVSSTPAPSSPATGALAKPEDGKLQFSFYATPWKEVLEWFAEQADLSLVIDVLPVGSFTYRDDRNYSVDQALDLLNSYLLTKGYTLVRRERLLLVIDLESPIPEELVTLVTIDELDKRGRYELVKCVFPLARMTADEARRMIEAYLGPQGMVIGFPAARQILVTETAGKLRVIRDMIARVEDPKAGGLERVVDFELVHVTADEVLAIARPLLGLTAEQNYNAEISISTDPLGMRLFATGNPDKMQLLAELIPRIDRESAIAGSESVEPEEPTLKTFYIKAADPQLVLRISQTLLANLPGVRMEIDATSNKLVALARESEHKMIEATIAQLEGQTKRFEVIQLKRTDPQFIVLALNKFFNLGAGETPSPDDPIIDGDPLTMKLWVRATEIQLEDIRQLIDKLEGPDDEETTGSNYRILPFTGPAAQSALDTVEQLWDRKNKIRMVTPSALKPTDIRLRSITPLDEEDIQIEGLFPLQPSTDRPSKPVPLEPSAGPRHDSGSAADRSAANGSRGPQIQFASQLQPAVDSGPEPAPASADQPTDGPPEIRVAITPNGLLIASDDKDALDKFEELLRMAAGPSAMAPQRQITVFYLKYAKAEVANTLLQEVLTGPGADSGGGSLLGDVTSNLLGGGLLGGLLGGLAGGTSDAGTSTMQGTGLITVVPDPRLNALIIEANDVDLQFVEQLLRVIDRESSITDIETAGLPRLIPVIHNSAEEIAGVVRQVYADRIATSGGQQRQPSPEDLIRALRGQRGGGNQESRGEVQKMTVGVDARSNALIVTAPEPLFLQVKALVEQIDQPGSPDSDVVSIVPIKVSDPEVVKKALGSLMTTQTTTRTTSGQPGGGTGGASAAEVDQRMEFLRRLRESGGFGGGGGPPGGFGGGPPGGMMGGAPPATGGSSRPTTGGSTRGGTTSGRGSRGGR